MNDISVVTLVKNRADHLNRLLAGVSGGTARPREIVVVDMSDTPVSPAASNIPTTIVPLHAEGLPLAAARNRGAEAACGKQLLFLDVDCIPRNDLVERIHRALVDDDYLFCAEVRYLGPDARHLDLDDALIPASIVHPHRQFPSSGVRREPNAGLFWSLLFGIRRDSFFRLNGFDEGYEGYGAEDTDFGFRAREAGLPLMFLGGTGAFHQYHGVIDPPLQHFSDIVRNANRFHQRWRLWPMQSWLASFAELGLVAQHDGHLEVLRHPTRAEIEAATQPPSVYF